MKKTQLLSETKITASHLLRVLQSAGIQEKENFSADEVSAIHQTIATDTAGQGFTPKAKGTRGICEAASPSTVQPQPQTCTAIPTARTHALALSAESHDAMSALQSTGLGNAAAYVQRKQMERNAVVERVSDAIAYLSDPDLLESDIMSAAAAKVAARSDAWGYAEPAVDFDNLFALPTSSQRMLGGV